MKTAQALLIYRAETIKQDFTLETDTLKKINGVWYAEGYYTPLNTEPKEHIIYSNGNTDTSIMSIVNMTSHEVDPSTLAIHFSNSNMEDSEGNRIFASLSSDGNGSDTFELTDCESNKYVMIWNQYKLSFTFKAVEFSIGCWEEADWEEFESELCKVTGIHTIEGEG